MAAAKKSRAAPPAPPDLSDDTDRNDATVHGGLHSDQEAELHFGDEIHGPDHADQNWKQPQQLEAPPPRDGFVQRWIRRSMLGKEDAKNQVMQGQQGWRPRSLENVPIGDRKNYATVKDPRTTGTFMINGDLILCEMRVGTFKQMQEYFRGRASTQVKNVVDENLAGTADPRGRAAGLGDPEVVERSSRVSTRSPIVAADKN